MTWLFIYYELTVARNFALIISLVKIIHQFCSSKKINFA